MEEEEEEEEKEERADETLALEAMNAVLTALRKLNDGQRLRVFQSVATFFGLTMPALQSERAEPVPRQSSGLTGLKFSEQNAPTPKQFINEKLPKTDVERIACLAYYLTHYRDLPHFKTLDLAKLNTEAAQPKFSNTAHSAHNAANLGYLAHAASGLRQLSASGEQFVIALPDREAAKKTMSGARPRRKSAKKQENDTGSP